MTLLQPRYFLSLAALAALAALAVTGCGSSPAATASPPAVTSAAAKPAAADACKLKTTFDYIVRDDLPGTPVTATEIGNVDFANCTSGLADFAATAGQAPGECTTIALASKNPGYDVNATSAAPLKDVIEAAGPGC